jgi:uncharacterized radical SAM superfamily Fe-S cluster-containing enzyme
MARAFGDQTGLTRFPDDWFPLNSISLLSRAIERVRNEKMHPPLSDAHCSIGTFFYVDDNNKPFCLSSFFDLDRFLRGMAKIKPHAEQGLIERQISKVRQFGQLSVRPIVAVSRSAQDPSWTHFPAPAAQSGRMGRQA